MPSDGSILITYSVDTALGVLAVTAHVPLAHRAVGTRHRVGSPDDASDQITHFERGVRARVYDPAQRLVSEHEACLALRRPAVLSLDDFDVGPAHADRDGFHQDRPAACVRLGDVFEACGIGLVRFNGDRLHPSPV
jgi:hypothetical protein